MRIYVCVALPNTLDCFQKEKRIIFQTTACYCVAFAAWRVQDYLTSKCKASLAISAFSIWAYVCRARAWIWMQLTRFGRRWRRMLLSARQERCLRAPAPPRPPTARSSSPAMSGIEEGGLGLSQAHSWLYQGKYKSANVNGASFLLRSRIRSNSVAISGVKGLAPHFKPNASPISL
jgi:hypothetical protein